MFFVNDFVAFTTLVTTNSNTRDEVNNASKRVSGRSNCLYLELVLRKEYANTLGTCFLWEPVNFGNFQVQSSHFSQILVYASSLEQLEDSFYLPTVPETPESSDRMASDWISKSLRFDLRRWSKLRSSIVSSQLYTNIGLTESIVSDRKKVWCWYGFCHCPWN